MNVNSKEYGIQEYFPSPDIIIINKRDLDLAK